MQPVYSEGMAKSLEIDMRKIENYENHKVEEFIELLYYKIFVTIKLIIS